MNYYIADPHFGHYNIIYLCKRPFKNVEEMNQTIITNWNKKVTDEDDVYILGDFSFRGKSPDEYLKQLKGRKHLIVGNHDKAILNNKKIMDMFVEVTNMSLVKDGDKEILCCHYPFAEWDGYFKGTYHFYGHVHNSKNKSSLFMEELENAYNVGVDVIGYEPKTLKEITGK